MDKIKSLGEIVGRGLVIDLRNCREGSRELPANDVEE
jgi:hypothetical protein